MNRLHHLRETLPHNLESRRHHVQHEFVVLDYNSTDGLEDWIKSHRDGKLTYYKTTEPSCYKRSHSRNMAMKLATGDVICNLDADNFLGDGFVDYIEKVFSDDNQIFLSPHNNAKNDVFGKLCFKKSDFMHLRGYDEQIECYGFEDNDLKARLEELELKMLTYENVDFQQAIGHSELERIENEFLFKNLKQVLIQKKTPFLSKFIFVLNDGTFESAIVEDCQYSQVEGFIRPLNQRDRYNIQNESEEKGNISEIDLSNCQSIDEEKIQIEAIHFYSQLKNKKHTKNKIFGKGQTINNMEGFGQGIVYKNFDYNNPINVF